MSKKKKSLVNIYQQAKIYIFLLPYFKLPPKVSCVANNVWSNSSCFTQGQQTLFKVQHMTTLFKVQQPMTTLFIVQQPMTTLFIVQQHMTTLFKVQQPMTTLFKVQQHMTTLFKVQ